MNYDEAREYLSEVSVYGSVLGLDNIRSLLSMLGNPERDLKVVHVAGTNGKGSTMAFLQSILMKAGYKVGRYSSPVVFEYREIIRINDEYIEEDEVIKIISIIKEKCGQIIQKGMPHPTVFEIETAMSFMYFKHKKCDIVLVECGMGGATDATNVFQKVLCSIITTISFDHMQFLGNAIEDIAFAKSGIIKEKCDVIVSKQSTGVLNVIQRTAEKREAQMVVSEDVCNVRTKGLTTFFEYRASDNTLFNVGLQAIGTYQIVNSTTAIEAALSLEKQGFEVKQYVESGLKDAVWNGRMEVVSDKPFAVIDGAHNPGAVKELKESVDLYFTNKRIAFIMGVLADKDFNREAQIIADSAVKIITVTPNNKRALDGERLAETLRQYNDNVESADDLEKAWAIAVKTVEQGRADMILAFGSLSYLGDLKAIINCR